MNMRTEGITDADLDRFEKAAEPIYRSTATAGEMSRFQVSDLGMWVIRLVAEVRRLRRSVVSEPSAAEKALAKIREASHADLGRVDFGKRVDEILAEHAGAGPQGEPSDALTIPRPHVPYGPVGIPEHEADADYLEHAASSLESRYEVGGSNVRATVVGILRDVATALRAAGGVR